MIFDGISCILSEFRCVFGSLVNTSVCLQGALKKKNIKNPLHEIGTLDRVSNVISNNPACEQAPGQPYH